MIDYKSIAKAIAYVEANPHEHSNMYPNHCVLGHASRIAGYDYRDVGILVSLGIVDEEKQFRDWINYVWLEHDNQKALWSAKKLLAEASTPEISTNS